MSEPDTPAATPVMLEAIAAEIDAFVGAGGWNSPTTLFALVSTKALAADPTAAAMLSVDGSPLDPDQIADEAITPIAQDELPEGALDEVLAQIGWPDEVIGCAVSQEILMLPPSAEAALDDVDVTGSLQAVVEHPDRREARLVVAVLRDGRSAGLLRLRATDETGDDLLTGSELAPNLVAALAATLQD